MTTPWTDFDADIAGFELDPGAGLTIKDDITGLHKGDRWLSWEETLALHAWLTRKIGGAAP